MDISVEPGKYVVAVSGGVDSVALLDMLAQKSGLELIVAHFDHGIRKDSHLDKDFVATVSQKYHLPFESVEGKLGPQASEAVARTARYNFLQQVRKNHQAVAIITAHHQDDALETAIFNVLRGTGRKGITSLDSTSTVLRPLQRITKQELIDYALSYDLSWREDQTNTDTIYTRNWIRKNIIPKLSKSEKDTLVKSQQKLKKVNAEVDEIISEQISALKTNNGLNKSKFIALPHAVAKEVTASWLRTQDIRGFDKKTIERIVNGVKILPAGKNIAVTKNHHILVESNEFKLVANNS